jgi:hypothetical protein
LSTAVVRAGLPFESLTLDLRSNARAFAQSLNDHHIIWVSTLRGNARITYRGRPQPVAEWAKHLPRHRIAGRPWAWVGTVPFPRNGTVRLVVATNGQGGLADIVSNDLHRRGKVLLHQERSRAHQDQLPRHQAAGWARSVSAPGAAGYKAARRSGPLVFVVFQQLRLVPSETVGEVKRRLHLSVIRGDQRKSGSVIASLAEGKIMATA